MGSRLGSTGENVVWFFIFHCSYVATASADRTVKVWDLQGGFCTHSFTGHRWDRAGLIPNWSESKGEGWAGLRPRHARTVPVQIEAVYLEERWLRAETVQNFTGHRQEMGIQLGWCTVCV